MTSRDFVYWLQGFAELNTAPPTEAQWTAIKNHLNLVFRHEIDPSMPDPTGELQAAHDGKVEPPKIPVAGPGNAIESDATATHVPCLDEHTVFVDPMVGDGSGFSVTPREARVLAARLIRAANMADFGSQTWKFKTLEGVECVNLNTDFKGRKVEP